MKKSEFIQEVIQEVEHLKKNATLEERMRLDFSKLDPQSAFTCIYGQMTGSCYSDRSYELCTGRYDFVPAEGDTFTEYKNSSYFKLNHTPSKQDFTALEAYINLKGAKNKHIIAYLRDEVPTLKL